MGLGFRFFLIDAQEHLKPLAMDRVNALHLDVPSSALPELAKQRVRYILVSYKTRNLRPQEVVHLDCGFLTFDSRGLLDRKVRDKEVGEAVEMATSGSGTRSENGVLDARGRFLRKRYLAGHTWQPSEQVLEDLRRALYGIRPPGD